MKNIDYPLLKTDNLDREFCELTKDIDYFGKLIKKGTRYYQSTDKDYYIPVINGDVCPAYWLHFTVVDNNPEYFNYVIAVVQK